MLLLISFFPNKSFNFSSCFSSSDFSLSGGGLENFFSCNIFSASSRICFFYKRHTKLYIIFNFRYKHHWPMLQILIRCNMHEIKSYKIFGRFLKIASSLCRLLNYSYQSLFCVYIQLLGNKST